MMVTRIHVAARRAAIDGPGLAYLFLHMTGVLAMTLLLTWGLFVLFFLAIGGFSLDGMMHQLANLTRRYVAADTDRIASFRATIIAAHLLLSAAILFLRRGALLPARPTTRSD